MKLIVGLGNPGNEYDKTRHNIGFMLVDYLFGDNFKLNKKFNAMEYETNILNEKVMVIKPLSYMNLSGEVVRKYVSFYKINLDDILVIQDDLDMDIGRVKFMYNHNDGGHNGIKNIILNLSSREFLRLKLGISCDKTRDTKDYVLGKFSSDDMNIFIDTFKSLDSIITDFVSMDRDRLIGKYNQKITR